MELGRTTGSATSQRLVESSDILCLSHLFKPLLLYFKNNFPIGNAAVLGEHRGPCPVAVDSQLDEAFAAVSQYIPAYHFNLRFVCEVCVDRCSHYNWDVLCPGD